MIRVELQMSDFIKARSEAEVQFIVRQTLRSAGIPIGPWGTSTVERGTLRWWDEWDRRIFELEEAMPA